MLITLVLIVIAYLLGSICSAILVCKALGYPDPRSEGSSNPGTTNVLRIAGKGPAALTLAGDVLKCVLPVLLGHYLNLPWLFLGFVGLAAFMGHLFPVFFNFEGGKGVATAFGFALALDWQFGLVCVGSWVAIAAITRYSSLAALITWTLAPFVAWAMVSPQLVFSLAPMSLMILYRHQDNIRKLRDGTESRIGGKKGVNS